MILVITPSIVPQAPFGLSLSKPVLSLPKRPCAYLEKPFDKLRTNGGTASS